MGSAPVLAQQSTYAPADGVNRFMGSAALDRAGDLAIGFSGSNASIHPDIRWAGRLAGDPVGTLAQGEATVFAGAGSQTASMRWGDYTTMAVDPVDGCTFWFVGEYLASTGTTWHTRIGTFSFPACTTPTAARVVRFSAHRIKR